MTIKNSTRFLAAILTLAMMLSFVACDFLNQLGGSLKLESFIIDPNSYKAEYVVGEEVDFSNIQAIVKYNDETLNKTYTAAELTIAYDADITAEVGVKEVTISFQDPNLNVKQEVKITIKVVEADPEATTPEVTEPTTPEETEPTTPEETEPTTPEETEPTTPEETEPTTPEETEPTTPEETEPTTPEETEPTTPEETTPEVTLEVVEFAKPSELVYFDSANKTAGTLSYGQAGFQSQFAIGGQLYVIGTQGEFKLNPFFSIWDDDAMEPVSVKDFFGDVVLSVKDGDAYVELTKKAKGGNLVEYYDGSVLLATVNVYKGTYQFTADAAGKQVKISVMPDSKYYYVESDIKPVVLEAKIINAYNIYEAWQLAAIDNYNPAWTDFKLEKGIANLAISGIVLHKNIHLSADDAPASFFYTTTAPVVYKNSTTGAETIIPAGTRYLVDGTFIYERRGAGDFAMEGNFFTLDTKGFPLVPSPAVFGKDSGRDYGVDFSNAALFRILVTEGRTEEVVNVTINNMSLIGNSARDNLIDATENLASAGGLIFFKSSFGANTTMNNVIGNSYFITYFTEYSTTLTVSNSKCYDSYQNAAFIWGDSTFNMIDSYVNGCGGPVIIAQSVWNENLHPVVNVTGGELETHLSGQEIWFTAVNATSIVGQIKGLGVLLQQNGLGTFVDANGQMNIVGAIMANGSSAADIITGIGAQGSIFVEGKGIDRTQSADNAQWGAILQISQYSALQSGNMPPFFTVFGADGTAYTLYTDGTNMYDLTNAQFNPMGNPDHAAIYAAFLQSDTFVLTQGGLSVVFEYYHY